MLDISNILNDTISKVYDFEKLNKKLITARIWEKKEILITFFTFITVCN